MTKEEKELLVKDLCGRLPYNVKVRHAHFNKNGDSADIILNTYNAHKLLNGMGIYALRPYLCPMSSMTKEEYNEYENYVLNERDELIKFCNSLNFYGRYHFDYRGLIPMGLALEAPEGMYK